MLRSQITARAVRSDQSVLAFMADMGSRAPSEADLQAARIRYQQELLHQCFDFSNFAGLLGRSYNFV